MGASVGGPGREVVAGVEAGAETGAAEAADEASGPWHAQSDI
jgi:hypothetical protein